MQKYNSEKELASAGVPSNEDGGQPVVFSGIFGWLHPGVADVGVVICPGIGQDARLSHTTLRRLAIELAHAGYPVLRFDYPGTGDSEDIHTADSSTGWMRGVSQAIRLLRRKGVQRIILCGFRLGALLALMTTTDREDIEGLVLIDPVVSGKVFLRELSISSSVNSKEQGFREGLIEIDGMLVNIGPSSPLQALDSFSLTSKPTKRILILSSFAARRNDRLAEHMRSLGVDVTQAEFQRIIDFDSDGYAGRTVDLDVIRSWLPAPVDKVYRPTFHTKSKAMLLSKDFLETPLIFGNGLFGILCRPSAEAYPGPLVIIGNGGAGPRYGSGRFHVLLARRLAAAGIPSFRLDFAGLGDSSPPEPESSPHVYETDRRPDIRAAIDALERLNYSYFVAAGVCSGAYHAWRAILQDERITTLVMINPVTFSWSEGQSLASLIHSSAHSTKYYFRIMSRGSGWKRLMSLDFGIKRIASTVRVQLTRRLSTMIGKGAGLIGLPTANNAPFRAMRKLSRRGVGVLVVIAADDGGMDVLSAHFGAGGRYLNALPGSAVRIMPDLDHSVSRRVMQKKVAEELLQFLHTNVKQQLFSNSQSPHVVLNSTLSPHESAS